ncbi:MAG: ATP-binding protein, partial [Proteobacteria bacterium]|nr:ATP-binding protein [Pseudomonadota bacterium]
MNSRPIRAFVSGSVTKKIVLTIVGSTIGVVGVLTIIFILSSTQLWKEELRNELNLGIDQAALTVEAFKNSQFDELADMFDLLVKEEQQGYHGLHITIMFSDFIAENPWVENIYLIKPNHNIFDHSGIIDLSQNGEEERKIFFNMLIGSKEDFFVSALPDPDAGEPMSSLIVKKQMSRNGVLLPGTYLVEIIDIDALNRHLFGYKRIGKEGPFLLGGLTPSGRIILSEAAFNSSYLDQNFSSILNSWSGLADISGIHDDLLIAKRTISGSSVVVVGIASFADIQEPVFLVISISIAFSLIVAILGMLVAALASRKLTWPIINLAETVKTIAQKATKPEFIDTLEQIRFVPKASEDEVSILNSSFQILVEELLRRGKKINEQIYNLNKLNKNLKEADQFKDELLSNVSHELQTPLHGIIGIAESLVDGSLGYLTDQQKSNLSIIISGASRLHNMINDVLDSNLLKNNLLTLQTKAVDVSKTTAIVFALFSPQLKGKSIHLIDESPASLPGVEADENRLQQILHNLIENSIKNTTEGEIKVLAKQKNEFVEIQISDTGSGIPSDKLAKIFDLYVQIDGSATRERGGMGLGLAITRHLVKLHGGDIGVNSEAGKGTTFTFTLPVSKKEVDASPVVTNAVNLVQEPEEDADAENHDDSVSTDKQFTILAVDDDPVNLQVIAHHLSNKNYKIITAENGLEAFNLVTQPEKPDLILLDVMMPKISGFELCRQIRTLHPQHELPIIFLTAKNQVSDLVEGFALGGNDYLTKPFLKRELQARVQNQIQMLHARDQLSSLRRYSEKFLSFRSTSQAMEFAFSELCQNVIADAGFYFQEGKASKTFFNEERFFEDESEFSLLEEKIFTV